MGILEIVRMPFLHKNLLKFENLSNIDSIVCVFIALRETIAGAPSRRKIIYMIHDLYERMSEEKDDWLVCS